MRQGENEQSQAKAETTGRGGAPHRDAVDFVQASRFCGQRAGFVFHVRDGKLGYHRDTASIKNLICSVLLADLVGPPEESSTQGRSTSRQISCRRRRGTDGNRIRPLSRRWRAGTCTPTP